ncbi:hypothetical protein LR48_Vigan09g133700 [Vigna angularis]|uniref:Ubiquitin-like protease family profile domain-containing protein n=1 Tax=Phaseolus angularis TaxID=3914 RepID=A0A0L9VCE8_PHAAN|nr:hypothetical protein LR48_Vigan09g133700 [Vigna angularis]
MFDVSNKKGFNDVYGFIDPSMTQERNKFDDIQTYITTYFGMGKEIYFLPYIHECHWQLLVISIPENTAVWFCSLHKSPPSPLRHIVDCSLATHMMLSGRSTATAKKLAWVALKVCFCSGECSRNRPHLKKTREYASVKVIPEVEYPPLALVNVKTRCRKTDRIKNKTKIGSTASVMARTEAVEGGFMPQFRRNRGNPRSKGADLLPRLHMHRL